MLERILCLLCLLWWGIPKSDKCQNLGTSWGHPENGVGLHQSTSGRRRMAWRLIHGEAERQWAVLGCVREAPVPGLQVPSPEQ